MCVCNQIISFDELKTDYKNPIDQCNSLNPVSVFICVTVICIHFCVCIFCFLSVFWVVFLCSFLLQYFDTVGWVF